MPTEISAHRLVESVVLRGEVGGVNKSGTASSTACYTITAVQIELEVVWPCDRIFNLVATYAS